MQVIFIHHSCFLVEVDEKVLIFDWFAGDRIKGYTFCGVIPNTSRTHQSMCLQVINIRIILIWMCCTGQKNIKISTIYFQKTVK